LRIDRLERGKWNGVDGRDRTTVCLTPGPASRPNDARLTIMGVTTTIVAPLRYVERFTSRDYDVT